LTEAVLDSSAVLAELFREPGADTVRAARPTACISAVNYGEVIARLVEEGVPAAEAEYMLERMAFDVVDADKRRSIEAGLLQQRTRRRGISLGDRYCLQLAIELGVPVLTADRRWAELDLGVQVELIR
jgi:PIN domain nuclease of toxin-antitoxin system